jgi:hypothetical protein
MLVWTEKTLQWGLSHIFQISTSNTKNQKILLVRQILLLKNSIYFDNHKTTDMEDFVSPRAALGNGLCWNSKMFLFIAWITAIETFVESTYQIVVLISTGRKVPERLRLTVWNGNELRLFKWSEKATLIKLKAEFLQTELIDPWKWRYAICRRCLRIRKYCNMLD